MLKLKNPMNNKNIIIFSLIAILIIAVLLFTTIFSGNKNTYNEKEYKHLSDSLNTIISIKLKEIDLLEDNNLELRQTIVNKNKNIKTITDVYKKDSTNLNSSFFNIDSFISAELIKRR